MIENITVIVPVKNEEKNLASCLASIKDFVNVIVVDSNSSDRTPQITAEFSRNLVQFNWDGQFPKKRNWALFNLDITTDWVLFLDADEVLTPSIIEELKKIKDKYVGYWLNYDNFFLRRPLKFGVAQRKLALFNKNFGYYESAPVGANSKLDMEVHEHPILNGKIGKLRGRIIHNDYQGYYKFRFRHLEYAQWEAERLRDIRNDKSKLKLLTLRQKVKYRLMASWFFAPSYFFYAYILCLGFLDGLPGYLYALEKLNYFKTIYMLTKEAE